MRKKLKQKNGITLIALVITIIVLLILAGISISMLSGDNSILQKATESKTNSEKQGIIEQARIDILGQQAENKGTTITKEQLVAILNTYFKDTAITSIPDEVSSEQEHDFELITRDDKYTIMLSEIFKGRFAINNVVEFQIGDVVKSSGLATFKDSSNNDIKWIYFGEDSAGKRLVTTEKPIQNGLYADFTPQNWIRYYLTNSDSGYESTTETNNINKACAKLYADNNGTVGTARSITMADINKVIGFTEPALNRYTFVADENANFSQNKVNYYYPSLLNARGFVKAGEVQGTEMIPEQQFDCNAYYYYKDDSDNKYKLYWEGELKDWQTAETDRITLPDNMKYVVGENNDLFYIVGTNSVLIHSYLAFFYGDMVYSGRVCYFDYKYFGNSGVNSGTYNSDDLAFWVPVRPVVSLESSVKLSKVDETE